MHVESFCGPLHHTRTRRLLVRSFFVVLFCARCCSHHNAHPAPRARQHDVERLPHKHSTAQQALQNKFGKNTTNLMAPLSAPLFCTPKLHPNPRGLTSVLCRTNHTFCGCPQSPSGSCSLWKKSARLRARGTRIPHTACCETWQLFFNVNKRRWGTEDNPQIVCLVRHKTLVFRHPFWGAG